MSELTQVAVGVAILDPSAHKSCPWSTCPSEAPAAGVTLSHDPSYFYPKKTPKMFPAPVTTPNSTHAPRKEGASHGSSQWAGDRRQRSGHQVSS